MVGCRLQLSRAGRSGQPVDDRPALSDTEVAGRPQVESPEPENQEHLGGPAPDAADRDQLFTAFRRGRNVAQVPGTGLGLVVIRHCLDLHNGSIEIQSAEIALTVLSEMARTGGAHAVSELGRQLGMPRAKVHRYLVSLSTQLQLRN